LLIMLAALCPFFQQIVLLQRRYDAPFLRA
jgi:hypothetical protein